MSSSTNNHAHFSTYKGNDHLNLVKMDSIVGINRGEPLGYNDESDEAFTSSTVRNSETTDLSPLAIIPKPFYRRIAEFITVEPMLLLQMIALSSTTVNVQAFYIEAICRREYNSSIDCSNLTSYPTQEEEVERQAAFYSTYRSLIEAGLPILFSLFLGPWSDKHGSKIPMILPQIGYILSTLMLYFFSTTPNINPNILLLASVPIALSGGLIAFILSSFRYIASITNTENRSFRIAVCEGSWFLGSPIGLLGSALLLKTGGYELVFMVSIILFTGALFYTVLCIKNDKKEDSDLFGGDERSMIKDMFNIEAVKETVMTCFRKREGARRMWILLLLGTIYLRILALYGSFTITYIYVRKEFQWTSAQYSVYTTIEGMLGIIGSSIVAVLGMKVLHVPDVLIGILSAVSYLTGSIIWALSSTVKYGWMMYFGGAAQMFCGLISIVIRSMISKLVSKDELGKVFSFLASGEAAMPIIAGPLYNLVYVKSVDFYPGTVFIMSSFFNLLILSSFIYFFISFWKMTSHDELVDEEDERQIDSSAH